AHLKLLKAFGALKAKVLGTSKVIKDLERAQHKYWQVFITNAVRRFIIFVSALRKYSCDTVSTVVREDTFFKVIKNKKFESMMSQIMPPLDVIMVWHAFLLNPKTFYDSFTRTDFIVFAKYPLPLDRIHGCIDNTTFEFNVPEIYRENYSSLLQSFTNDPNDLIFDPIDDLSAVRITDKKVKIYCPRCQKLLTFQSVPLMTTSETGFADPGFEAYSTENIDIDEKIRNNPYPQIDCICLLTPVWNHDQLRKLQLYHDVHGDTELSHAYKYFSSIISRVISIRRSPYLASPSVKSYVKNRWNNLQLNLYKEMSLVNLIKSVSSLPDEEKRLKNLLLRSYLQFNLIYFTVRGGIKIGEDLVGCVLRQERFVEKMNTTLNWLHSPFIYQTLSESSNRYVNFFHMLTSSDLKQMLVPTLDIDLMWHTHQLWNYGYFKDCLESPCHTGIDHDDTVDENKLDDGYEFTRKLYRKLFNQEYSICYCHSCIMRRMAAASKFSILLKSGNKQSQPEEPAIINNPLFSKDEGFSHISTHNSIKLPTSQAQRTSTLNEIDISMDPPRYNQVLDFIAILEQSDPTAFQSYNYSTQKEYPSIQRDKVTQINSKGLPTIADVVAHLKLLKAFGALKAKVLGTSSVIKDLEPTQHKYWQVFLTNAVRRFIIFVSALRKYSCDIQQRSKIRLQSKSKPKRLQSPKHQKGCWKVLVPAI
ncbi:hypothetical protein MGS_01403, partial [Candida albicans P78042]